MPDRVAHAPHLAVPTFVDAELDRGAPPVLLHEARRVAGAVEAVVELDAVAQRGAARQASGSPSTSARYVFTTPWRGWVSSCVRSPSLVSSRRPSVS